MITLRLAGLRNKKGVSQAQLAEYLKITHQAYSLYETNKRQMNYETLCLIADFFEVSTDYLLGREEAIPSYLDDEESYLIERFRVLDNRGKENIKATLPTVNQFQEKMQRFLEPRMKETKKIAEESMNDLHISKRKMLVNHFKKLFSEKDLTDKK